MTITDTDALKILLTDKRIEPAPIKTKRYGRHWCVTIAIDNDHTAELTLSDEAYEALTKSHVDPNQNTFDI